MTIKKSFIADITIQTVLPSIINNALLSNGGYILEGDDTNNLLKGGKGNDVLYGGAGNDTLTGGVGADTMAGGVGGDTYYVDNINDVVIENPTTRVAAVKNVAEKSIIHWDDPPPPPDLINSSVSYTLPSNIENLTLSGTAPLNGTGNQLNNVLTGNTGNNILLGLSGNDSLLGGGGNDTLDGGDDNDVLTGGTGNDVFRLGNLIDNTNIDRITDMNNGNDSIYLENGIFTKLPAAPTVPVVLPAAEFKSNSTGVATESDDYIVYNTTNGNLFYDADGKGSGVAIKVAILSTHPALTAADFYIY